jgi:hypothetical protein
MQQWCVVPGCPKWDRFFGLGIAGSGIHMERANFGKFFGVIPGMKSL